MKPDSKITRSLATQLRTGIQAQGPRSLKRLNAFPLLVATSAAYGTIVFGSLVAAFALATALHATPAQSTGFVALGLLVGIFGGLLFNFAMGPVQLKQTLHAQPLSQASLNQHPTTLGEMIQETFNRQEMKTPQVFLVSDEESKLYGHTVLISGFSFGRGIFRPALFISEAILAGCSEEEFKSILTHEMAHLQSNHLFKRISLMCGGFLTATFLSSIFVAAFHVITEVPIQGPLLLLNLLVPVTTTLWLVKKQSFRHEHEADAISVKRFGSSPQALKSALEKLETLNLRKDTKTSTLTQSRLQALDQMSHPDAGKIRTQTAA
ncbi:MAG: M48 family metalloprotease [Methylotenera sp.]|nr:M48 family metalloprotease [Oligoflexia bacterium]